MSDFWRSSGYHLTRRDPDGALLVTDDFLRAYLARPEIRPVEESCAAEIALHEALMATPSRAVDAAEIGALAEPDARENYQVFLGFRDRLIAAGTLERCYLDLFEAKVAGVPSLFVDQLVHVVARGLLEGCEDPLRVRAAEVLFRPQKVTILEGAIMLADEETVEMYARTAGFGGLGELLVKSDTPTREVVLDVITETNAPLYWSRDERHDMVLNLSFGQPGLDALCRVFEAWLDHFLKVDASIQPVQQIRDERWVWHIGLDVEATSILNDLYHGVDVNEDRIGRILSLFRMDVQDPSLMAPEIAGRPIYLAMAMTPDNNLRLKPQNLLVNFPLAPAA